MLRDIGRFAVAVVWHWQGLVTGGVITALVLLYVVVFDHQFSRETYLLLFLGIFLPMSGFLAWRDEHRKAELLDDRRRQQEKADEYAPLVDQGRKIMVKWVAASRPEPRVTVLGGNQTPPAEPQVDENAVQRAAAFDWLARVRAKLTEDFGPAVGSHFNLGKPADANLGVSEPREHEARVVALDKLIAGMRAGDLPVRVPRA